MLLTLEKLKRIIIASYINLKTVENGNTLRISERRCVTCNGRTSSDGYGYVAFLARLHMGKDCKKTSEMARRFGADE